MADKVFITLEVDDKGSKIVKKFEGNTDRAFDKLKKNAKAGATQAGKMERAWRASVAHMKANWKSYAIGAGVALAATAYALKQFADASREAFKQYNTALTDMGKITDETVESIARKIGSIGPEYGDATELTKAYYNVVSAGVAGPVAKMDTLKESVKAAKAAHIESADTVMGITALMEAYGDAIDGASESADLLFQMEASGKTTVKELIPYIGELAGKSAALNITQDELGASFAQITLLAGSTSNAATQYKAILTSLMAPSEAMIALLDGYGGAQQAIKDMGFEGVLRLISDATGGNAAELTKLMGSAEAVGGMLTLLAGDMEGYTGRLDDMSNKTGLADKAFKDWQKSMEGIEATYDAAVKNIMIAFGEEIAPMVASSMQLLIDIAPKMISAIHTGFDFIQVSGISLVDQLIRGWIDIEYAFRTMVAGVEGAWHSGINVLEEGFADFLDAVAEGLDKIPFFSDNATASMRELADNVRANTSENEGFVASIMKVQAEKEKELAAHNKIINVMMAEALGYKETALEAANAAVEKAKAAESAINKTTEQIESTEALLELETKLSEMRDENNIRQLEFLGRHNEALDLQLQQQSLLAEQKYQATIETPGVSDEDKLAATTEFLETEYQLHAEYARRRAELWWNNAQTYINFAQQMSTMGIQYLLAEGAQKEKIGRMMLATSIRFLADGLQQFMFTKAKENLIAAFSTASYLKMKTIQAAAEMTIGGTMAAAWTAYFTALSLNPLGGQIFIPAAMAMGAATAGFGAAAGVVAATGATSMAGSLAAAAAWTAGGIAVGAIGEVAASAIEGGGGGGQTTIGGGTDGGYTLSSPDEPQWQAATPSAEPVPVSRTVNIQIYGNVVDHDEFARELVPSIEKAMDDGVH